MEERGTVVLDIGSSSCIVDFSDQDEPRHRIPSVVGRLVGDEEQEGQKQRASLVGVDAEETSERMAATYPIKRGLVQDWDGFEKLVEHVYANALQVEARDHPLLMSEVPCNPDADRERMTELMFERFDTPALFLENQASLALFAAGRTTGVVLSYGTDVTHAVPVYETYAIRASTRTLPFGGDALTEHLASLLGERGLHYSSREELRIVEGMKAHCLTSLRSLEGNKDVAPSDMEKVISLPGGQEITLGAERFLCPEALFTPSLLGLEEGTPGIHEILSSSIWSTDIDVRKHFYWNVLLTGSGGPFWQMGDWLQKELQALTPSTMAVKMVRTPFDTTLYPWTGGALHANVGGFEDLAITKEDYDETGPAIVHRKCI